MPYDIFFFNVCEKCNMREVGQELLSFLLVGRENILIEPANFITLELLEFLRNRIGDHTSCEMQCMISI